MFESHHPSEPAGTLKLAEDIALAATFGKLELLRGEFRALTDLPPGDRSRLESALATRERELIQFYTCRG